MGKHEKDKGKNDNPSAIRGGPHKHETMKKPKKDYSPDHTSKHSKDDKK